MARYSTLERRITEFSRVRYVENPVYPDIPNTADDIYVRTTFTDRYDTLANEYYNDPGLWWIIANANPTSRQDSLVVKPGIQLRIPANHQRIVADYERINAER
jgi:chitinase